MSTPQGGGSGVRSQKLEARIPRFFCLALATKGFGDIGSDGNGGLPPRECQCMGLLPRKTGGEPVHREHEFVRFSSDGEFPKVSGGLAGGRHSLDTDRRC